MTRHDVPMPDFSSVLLGGDDSQTFGKKTAVERASGGEPVDNSGIAAPPESRPIPVHDSSSESETEDICEPGPVPDHCSSFGSETEDLYESETECDFPEFPESPESCESSESSESSESAESSVYDSESDCDSDDESSSDDDSCSSRESDIGECDEEECGVEHVYEQEEDTDDEGEEEGGEEEGGIYDDTDLGGQTVDTASMIAASVVAGAGAVRSGTGWTWTSMFIVLSAAGGVGIVLLYAIKRINELTRLVKTLEENSHMAINERDVQVITTQVIGDMLEDTDNSRDATIDTPEGSERGSSIETPHEVQRECIIQTQAVDRPQFQAELLQDDDIEATDNGGARAEEESLVVSESKNERSPLVSVDVLKEPATPSVAAEEERKITTIDKPVEQKVEEIGKDEPDDSIVDDLATMVKAMSLSEDSVETEGSSRLITGTKRVRSV
ncbi:unnamed protein product [Ectocarpus sp. 6 AP-2014]